MKSFLRRGRFTLLALVFLLLVSSITLPIGHTLLFEVLGVSGSAGMGGSSNSVSRSAASPTPTAQTPASPTGALLELWLRADGSLDLSRALYSAYGEVCLTNAGTAPTSGLSAIMLSVERQDGENVYVPLPGATLTIPYDTELAPGEKRCISFALPFEESAHTGYRVVARAAILNPAGSIPSGVQAAAIFALPLAPAPTDGEVEPTKTASLPEPSATPTALGPQDIVPTATREPTQQAAAPTQDNSLPTLVPTEAVVEQPTAVPTVAPEPTAVPLEATEVPVDADPTEPAP